MADRDLRSPYEGARVEELEEPLLPRWFVLLALLAIPVALGVGIWAFVGFGGEEIPVAARRPAPDPPLTTAVGQFNVGNLDPEAIDTGCAFLEGIRGAGTPVDLDRIAFAVNAYCDINVPGDVARRLQTFGRVGGVVRFAQFEATGVDSTLDASGDVPVVLVNARLARQSTDPLWISPLLAHDLTYLEEDPTLATSALTAREAEADICARLFVEDRPSRACDDADALLALPDPLAELRENGFE